MADTSFKVGDLVRLKSGGPTMTVDDTDKFGDIECVWFAGKKLERDRFAPGTLELASGDKEES
jgi:uncharacterized protein YodC (DUF2158 family)